MEASYSLFYVNLRGCTHPAVLQSSCYLILAQVSVLEILFLPLAKSGKWVVTFTCPAWHFIAPSESAILIVEALVCVMWYVSLCVCAPGTCHHKTYLSLIIRLWVSASSLLAFYMECFHQDLTIHKSVVETLQLVPDSGKIWWKCGNWGVSVEAQGCVDVRSVMWPWSDIWVRQTRNGKDVKDGWLKMAGFQHLAASIIIWRNFRLFLCTGSFVLFDWR